MTRGREVDVQSSGLDYRNLSLVNREDKRRVVSSHSGMTDLSCLSFTIFKKWRLSGAAILRLASPLCTRVNLLCSVSGQRGLRQVSC